jgi:hypothetical protein
MQSPFSCLSPTCTYQRLTHGGSNPSRSHSSKAAVYKLTPCTTDHSSKAWPCDPQAKQWYRPKRRFTENERLREFCEPCTGQAPRHWSPRCTVGSNCKRRKTSRMVIRSQSSRKSTPGIVSSPFSGIEKRNRYCNRPRSPTEPTAWFAWADTDESAEDRWPPQVSPNWPLPASSILLC